jgi:hypothetical protein
MDADYYGQKHKSRRGINTYRLRQQRRSQILLELADNDLRRRPRLLLSTDVILFSLTQGRMPGRISDIGEFGFTAVLPLELPLGELVRGEIHLPFGTKIIKAVVRSRNSLRHGFEFTEMDLSEEMRGWMH